MDNAKSPLVTIVCGGRDYSDRQRVYEVLDLIHGDRGIAKVVHGAARGADTLAGDWARSRGVEEARYPADWNRHGNAAGPIRNKLMLDSEPVTHVVAFPGGNGTANMIAQAKARGAKVVEIKAHGEE